MLQDTETMPVDGRAFALRLQARRQEQGLRKQELAAKVGVSLTTIQQYENGQLPKGEFAIKLGQVLCCSLDWLLAGKGEADIGGADAEGERLLMVPMVQARLATGAGGFESSGNLVRHYAFRWKFLHRKGDPARMVLLRASGDSMAPQIQHNDVVLIDQSQRDPVPGRIYAVGVEDMVYLKTVNAMPGRIILSSCNEAYPPIEVENAEQLHAIVRILGRAIWVGRELE